MNNILVTGSNGQLGAEIKALVLGEAKATHPKSVPLGCAALAAPSDNDSEDVFYFFTDSSSLNITDFSAVEEFIEKNNINTIINCAAYTAVDKAESDEENADKINHLAVKYLAEISTMCSMVKTIDHMLKMI